jgi:lipopolysaccharide/colanic/teichoic acid biosynthesis glycosyltransferase
VGLSVKRVLDVCVSLSGLLLAFPVMIAVAILIKIDSKGPVFYRGIRAGRYGRTFRIFKFRTMVDGAEGKGGPSTALNDARLTRLGRALRKGKIDELPQLFNILAGDMSVVGPRPQVEMYTNLYTAEEKAILSVRPGLTDYASLRYLDLDLVLGNHNVDEKYRTEIEPEKNRLRLKYVRERTLLVDAMILFQTALLLLGGHSRWNTKNLDQPT